MSDHDPERIKSGYAPRSRVTCDFKSLLFGRSRDYYLDVGLIVTLRAVTFDFGACVGTDVVTSLLTG
ncbi:hypothetical protein TNCV_401981 [Trichonephila clavipes]|nr:hypothetical protein TNCV_401981 [Trichonephila clavipes]